MQANLGRNLNLICGPSTMSLMTLCARMFAECMQRSGIGCGRTEGHRSFSVRQCVLEFEAVIHVLSTV